MAADQGEMSQAAVVEQSPDSSSRVMQLLRRHPLISFFVMAYAISWTYVIVFLLAVVSFSVLITWAFNNTGGSLLIAILIHTAINFTQAFTSDLFPVAAYNEVVPVAVLGTAAVIVVIATRGRLGFKQATA